MLQNLRWRVGVALFVAAICVVYLLPALPGVRESSLADLLPDSSINLGLDLQGGMHLTLGVDMDTAIQNALGRQGRDLRDVAREEKIVVLRPQVTEDNQVVLELAKAEQKAEFEAILKDRYPSLAIADTENLANDRLRYTLEMTKESQDELESLTLDQAVKTIRNRIDEFGVNEPDIRPQRADHRIIIQLPGLEDRERALDILGKTALLEFKLVRQDVEMSKARQGIVPGVEVITLQDRQPDGSIREIPIAVDSVALMTGDTIENAMVQFGQGGEASVSLNFDSVGARLFERITEQNVNKPLAIVLDGVAYSAPNINERIGGGRAAITGGFTLEEARDLALILRAGALPAPVSVLEERSVGPSLGEESIQKGITAALLGGIVVAVFMAIYYGLAGMVANMCLFLNIFLIMSGMAAFGATLTLPGIAGIILTLGMAVDANVLIFERIREEIRRGLTPKAALNEGFSRATLTIIDANVTTIIAAIILFQFGTGPIRGFAVTLSFGILASMFTAVFVSRIFLDLWVTKKPDACMSI